MECLPQMKKKHPETLTQLHATFTEKVAARLQEDMDELLADLKLQEKLDFLDQLESEQAALSQGETVWLVNFLFCLVLLFHPSFIFITRRPSGVPAKDLLAYDVPTLQSHHDELANYLKELQRQNEQEKKQLSEAADEIRNTEKKIVQQLERNEKAFHTLSSIYST